MNKDLFFKALVDNIDSNSLLGEWGLSIYIEYKEKKILLDAGTTSLFSKNAEAFSIDLNDIDFAVLSHAHYDHANGFDEFFKQNSHAKLYLQNACGQNCYSFKNEEMQYIGIKDGILDVYNDRLNYINGDLVVKDGIYLISHQNSKFSSKIKTNMFVKKGDKYLDDEFRHEQSLVFETEKGLVIFNSCCHVGVDNVIDEIKEKFNGKKIYTIVGGFHLFNKSQEEILAIANTLKDKEVDLFVTGHCTGNEAYLLLKNGLGDRVQQMYVGYNLDI